MGWSAEALSIYIKFSEPIADTISGPMPCKDIFTNAVVQTLGESIGKMFTKIVQNF